MERNDVGLVWQLWRFVWAGYFSLFTMQISMADVRIQTSGQLYVLNPGQSVHLDCVFFSEEFNLSANPLVWKKTQKQETTQINFMDSLLEPFVGSSRFRISVRNTRPKYGFYFSIANAQHEDSGNYTCEVQTSTETVLASAMHHVFVRVNVDAVVLSIGSSTADSEAASFVENVPRAVGCFSRGANPAPRMTVSLGHRNITDRFRLAYASSVEGVRGFRRIKYRVELQTDRLSLTANEDGATLRCQATVPGLAPKTTTVIVSVDYGPMIVCGDTWAVLNMTDVAIVCFVRARPEVSQLYWFQGQGGIAETLNTDSGYSFRVTSREDGSLESRLIVARTTEASFGTYLLVAENAIARTVHSVKLFFRSFEQQPTVAVLPIQRGEGNEEEEGGRGRGEENGRTPVESLCAERFDCRRRHAAKTNSLISDASENIWRYISSRAGHDDGRGRSEAVVSIILLIFVSI